MRTRQRMARLALPLLSAAGAAGLAGAISTAWADDTTTTSPSPQVTVTTTATKTVTATATPSGLFVHAVIRSTNPHPGNSISAQVWVAASGKTATDATLALSSSPSATITPTCTVVSGRCKLGNVGTGGVTIPLTITAPSSTGTLTLTAKAAAANTSTVTTTTSVSVTAAGSTPTPTVTVTTTRTAYATAPPVAAPPPVAPQTGANAAPTSPITAGELPNVQPEVSAQTTLTDGSKIANKHSAASMPESLTVGQGSWLFALLLALGITTAVLQRRRLLLLRANGRHALKIPARAMRFVPWRKNPSVRVDGE